MGNTASIDLVITAFTSNPNGAPSGGGAPGGAYCTVQSITVTDSASGQVTTSGTGANTTIKIKQNNPGNNPIFLTFNISAANDTTNYNPQAMILVGPNGSPDPDGGINFPVQNRNPNNQSITIKDTCTHKNGTSWKYYIQIKQMNAVGAQPLGWIDPDMQNDN